MLGLVTGSLLLIVAVQAIPDNIQEFISFKDGYSTEAELKADYHHATWTEFNSATEPSQGTGDYENVYYWLTYLNPRQQNCSLWCDQPLAMKWRVNPEKAYPAGDEQIAKCAVVDIARNPNNFYGVGFHCFNYRQRYITEETGCQLDNYNQFCMDNSLSFATERSMDKCDVCADFQVKFLCKEPYEPLYSQYPAGCPISVNPNTKREVDAITADLKIREEAMAKQQLQAKMHKEEQPAEKKSEDVTGELQEKKSSGRQAAAAAAAEQKNEKEAGVKETEKSLDAMKSELRLLQLLRQLLDKQ